MKTKEQTAAEYAKVYLNHDKSKIYEALIWGINFAEQWIDVNDELPEIIKGQSEKVLVKDKQGEIYLATCNPLGDEYIWIEETQNVSGCTVDNVTHWRPINKL